MSQSSASLRVTHLNLPQSAATFLNFTSSTKTVQRPDIASATSWTNEEGNGVIYLSTWTSENGWEIESSAVAKGSTTSIAGSCSSDGTSIIVNGTDEGMLNLNIVEKTLMVSSRSRLLKRGNHHGHLQQRAPFMV